MTPAPRALHTIRRVPRLGQIAKSDDNPKIVRRMYRRLFGDRDPVAEPGTATGTPGDWWTVFANSPDVLEHAGRGFALYASPERKIPAELRELGQTRAGWLVGSQFVFSQHCKACRALGFSEEKIEAIKHVAGVGRCSTRSSGRCSPTPTASCCSTGESPTACSTRLKKHLDDEAILEFTYITMMYAMHAVMSVALRTGVRRSRRPDRRGRGARGLPAGQPRPSDQRA